MGENVDYLKLAVEDCCVHQMWKARQHGYEEAVKLFNKLDEKSTEWSKFSGLVKNFVADANAAAQEKGLEATLVFVEKCGSAGKTANDVVSGIVSKGIAAPETKTRELSLQIILMFVEIKKQDAVQVELVKGMDHKNPKIVSECISAVTTCLRVFGSGVITIKPLFMKMPSLFENRDKTVRENAKAMVIEIQRWVGEAIKPQLSSLKPAQVTELEAEFEKNKDAKAAPTRCLRSQQAKPVKEVAEAKVAADDNNALVERDPFEMLPAADILSNLPPDFYETINSQQWQNRKETLINLQTLLKESPKLQKGNYQKLVDALLKIITEDRNIQVVTIAATCLASIANGLKMNFSPHATKCIETLLEKFREKKANIFETIRHAIDAVSLTMAMQNVDDNVIKCLKATNPSVKAETAFFLNRCFTKCTVTQLKRLLANYSVALVSALNDQDPSVRQKAAEAFGTALKMVGESTFMSLVDVDETKLAKIRECSEKAVTTAEPAKASSTERPHTAPASHGKESSPPVHPTAPKSANPTSGQEQSTKPASAPPHVTNPSVRENGADALSTVLKMVGADDSNSVALVSALKDQDPSVRVKTAEALRTALKMVGERLFTSSVNLDDSKLARISEKAVTTAEPTKASSTERPHTAPASHGKESSPPVHPTAPKSANPTSGQEQSTRPASAPPLVTNPILSPFIKKSPEEIVDYFEQKVIQNRAVEEARMVMLDPTIEVLPGPECAASLEILNKLIMSENAPSLRLRLDDVMPSCIKHLESVMRSNAVYSKEQTVTVKAIYTFLKNLFEHSFLARTVYCGYISRIFVCSLSLIEADMTYHISNIENFDDVFENLVEVIVNNGDHSQVVIGSLYCLGTVLLERIKNRCTPRVLALTLNTIVDRVLLVLRSWEPSLRYSAILYTIMGFIEEFDHIRKSDDSLLVLSYNTVMTFLYYMVQLRKEPSSMECLGLTGPGQKLLNSWVELFLKEEEGESNSTNKLHILPWIGKLAHTFPGSSPR